MNLYGIDPHQLLQLLFNRIDHNNYQEAAFSRNGFSNSLIKFF